ncbi:hypothetical protein [Tenacibaculum sp.]|uniref:hypothetical protein n=1 Tax=Tenacibaculum sp. TaxID=1906242 RepID=UPI003D0A3C88
MKVALIDADSIIHIVAYSYVVPNESVAFLDTEEDKEAARLEMYNSMNSEAVLAHIDSFLNDIIVQTESTHYLGFLGAREGSNTFRHKAAKTKPYKGQRGKTPHWTKYWKPIMVEHMMNKWGFIELFNIEADDAVAMCATHFKTGGIDYCVCSPDKDLKQIPGKIYDYKKQEHHFITDEDSIRILYSQCLVGDSTDNIGGCPKVGEKSPHLQFPGCNTPEDFHRYTYNVFKEKGVPELMEEMLMLVYMLRVPDGVDIYEIPKPIEYIPIGDKTDEFSQDAEIDDITFEPPTFSQ